MFDYSERGAYSADDCKTSSDATDECFFLVTTDGLSPPFVLGAGDLARVRGFLAALAVGYFLSSLLRVWSAVYDET